MREPRRCVWSLDFHLPCPASPTATPKPRASEPLHGWKVGCVISAGETGCYSPTAHAFSVWTLSRPKNSLLFAALAQPPRATQTIEHPRCYPHV